MERFFKLKENHTNVRTEIIAGLTTFLAMAYILGVNPSVLASAGMDMQSVFTATAVSAGIASILMGVLSNYPVALAAGMGVNAFFAYTVCGAMGYSWQAALAAVFLSGLFFVLITATGIRQAIINAIPMPLKNAIGAGIGFFIAFVGLKNAGVVVANESTAVSIGDLSNPAVLLAVFGIAITIVLIVRKVPSGVFVGMLITAAVGLILGLFGVEGMPSISGVISFNIKLDTCMGFLGGFKELFSKPFDAAVVIFSFLFVDFFDTAGTLISVGNQIGLIDKDGKLINGERALLADAIGTVVGAALGTSTVTSYSESTSGVGAGGRTGLTAVTTGILFLLSMFFSPLILGIATSAVTAPALIVVGIMMTGQLGQINWDDFIIASAAFVTIISMLLMYSISNGIACGFLIYSVGMIASKRGKEMPAIIYGLDVLFIIYFISLAI